MILAALPDSRIEWFVMGAAAIMLVYHVILYIQQKDKFLILYSNYLFSVVIYLIFRKVTHYDSFSNTEPTIAHVFDHPMILFMLFSYVYFIAQVLDIHNNARIVKFTAIAFYYTIAIFFIIHVYKVLCTDEVAMQRVFFLITKSILLVLAFTGLSGAFIARKTTFVRIIILGGVFYATFSLLTVISVYTQSNILGMHELELYFIGCFIDILLFSTALGYRSYLINQEKVITQKLLTEESEKNKELLQIQHNILQKESKREQALASMNKHLQDEVGASLSSIHVFADLSAKIMETNPEKSKEYIERIASLGQSIMDDIGDIIWLANLQEDNHHEAFLTRIKNYSHEILVPKQIDLILKVLPEFYKVQLTESFLREGLIRIKAAMKEAIDAHSYTEFSIEIFVNSEKPIIKINDQMMYNE
ncbi:MAG TPA: 7TM diverse intracellular signaling domain-containing protein [Saprospiraceae bacterium]|nr:7TM diverse intracellular signaling domain-containing protein [Saprospiraceae bacterium]